MIIALLFSIMASTRAEESTEATIRAAIERFHARTITASEYTSEVRKIKSTSPMGTALATLFRLAASEDSVFSLAANIALLDGGYYWTDEEFAAADKEWRLYVSCDRWFGTTSEPPTAVSSNELMTRCHLENSFVFARETMSKAFDADAARRRAALVPLLKINPWIHDETVLPRLSASNDPLARISVIQFGRLTPGSDDFEDQRKEFETAIHACLRSRDWAVVQQGLRWGPLVVKDFDREAERLLHHSDLGIRMRTARFLAEKGRVAANLLEVVRDGLNSTEAMLRCSALVLLRLKPDAAPQFVEQMRAALADSNAVVSSVAGATLLRCWKSLGNFPRRWLQDRDPLVRCSVVGARTRISSVAFLEYGDLYIEKAREFRSVDAPELLLLANDGVKDADIRVQFAAIELCGLLSGGDAAPQASQLLRSLIDSPIPGVAAKALTQVAKYWRQVADLPPALRAQAMKRVLEDFRSHDWPTYCDARCVLVNLPELAMPLLMPLLESKEMAALRNKLILEHYPFETEREACFSNDFVPYELDQIAGRTAHLVEMLSNRDFGFHFQKLWNVHDNETNPNGRHENLYEGSPARRRERDDRFITAIARANTWWEKSGATYSRLSTLVESLKSNEVDRQRRALEYLAEGAAVCKGLNETSWRQELRPAVERLKNSKVDPIRNLSERLLGDETHEFLKIKDGRIWTIR